MTASERALSALFDMLKSNLPADVAVLRGEVLPARIPSGGCVILRDGDPGEPEVWLSPPGYYYEHLAVLEVVVDRPRAEDRAAAFDALKAAIGQALDLDRSLGGAVEWCEARAPSPIDLPVDGGDGLKAAEISVLLAYATGSPLL